MKKYFYSNGSEKQGPLSFEELKNENISPETLIWFEGLENWKPAKDIKLFDEIFRFLPPPIIQTNNEPNSTINELEEKAIDLNTLSKNKTYQIQSKSKMFSNMFSFSGRIRRLEYGISFIVNLVLYTTLTQIIKSGDESAIFILAYIPLLWFILAQGYKRCHDFGIRGWLFFFPIVPIAILFFDGDLGTNKYGHNPKGLEKLSVN